MIDFFMVDENADEKPVSMLVPEKKESDFCTGCITVDDLSHRIKDK
jgi:hypothetical protein